MPDEGFRDWVARTSQQEIVARWQPFAGGTENEDLFVDWGGAETYSLKLGRGECAA